MCFMLFMYWYLCYVQMLIKTKNKVQRILLTTNFFRLFISQLNRSTNCLTRIVRVVWTVEYNFESFIFLCIACNADGQWLHWFGRRWCVWFHFASQTIENFDTATPYRIVQWTCVNIMLNNIARVYRKWIVNSKRTNNNKNRDQITNAHTTQA